jgi:hypothetical protein
MFDVFKPEPAIPGTSGATAEIATTDMPPMPEAPRPIPVISGATFEQTMRELGYPAWYRDNRVTRAIDAAWQECCETGSKSPFDIATAAKARGLPPVPTNKWV